MTELERGQQFLALHTRCGGRVEIESGADPTGASRLACSVCGAAEVVLVTEAEGRAAVTAALRAFGCAPEEIVRLTSSGAGLAEIGSMIRAIGNVQPTRRH